MQQEKTSISSTTSIVGDIKAEEDLTINGRVRGNIEVKGHNFVLGPSGRLEGEIYGQNAKISGQMKGEIKARGKVEITKEAKFSGKIESKSIAVESGAFIDAFVNTGQKSPETETLIDKSTENPTT
jgi:cytoskeletal protein CcmA (bactofilin family)